MTPSAEVWGFHTAAAASTLSRDPRGRRIHAPFLCSGLVRDFRDPRRRDPARDDPGAHFESLPVYSILYDRYSRSVEKRSSWSQCIEYMRIPCCISRQTRSVVPLAIDDMVRERHVGDYRSPSGMADSEVEPVHVCQENGSAPDIPINAVGVETLSPQSAHQVGGSPAAQIQDGLPDPREIELEQPHLKLCGVFAAGDLTHFLCRSQSIPELFGIEILEELPDPRVMERPEGLLNIPRLRQSFPGIEVDADEGVPRWFIDLDVLIHGLDSLDEPVRGFEGKDFGIEAPCSIRRRTDQPLEGRHECRLQFQHLFRPRVQKILSSIQLQLACQCFRKVLHPRPFDGNHRLSRAPSRRSRFKIGSLPT